MAFVFLILVFFIDCRRVSDKHYLMSFFSFLSFFHFVNFLSFQFFAGATSTSPKFDLYFISFEPHHDKNMFMPYANNKDADRHLYTPSKQCLLGGILYSCCPPVRDILVFFNILKRQWWKFCRYIDIDKMYVYNRKLRARSQFCWSYCPL